MASEWDVLTEIRTAMMGLTEGSQPTMSHIKSHQDDKRPVEELSIPAQMNCAADKLADEYLKQNPDVDHTKVPMLPTSGCQLHLSHGTVTHNLKLAMTHARTIPPFKKKLCSKHAWSEEDFDDIDWTAHGQALKRIKKHRKTIVQYVNDWLPVGKRVHTYDPKYPESCPSCPAQVEDTEHLQNCQAQSRKKWRKECHSAMLKALKATDTALPLQELLLEALKALLHGRPTAEIHVDPAVADVAAAQEIIGWHHILKGRFSKSWKTAQDKYLGPRTTTRANGAA